MTKETKSNVIIEGYWSNSIMNGAVLNVGGGIKDSHVWSALRMFPGNNGGNEMDKIIIMGKLPNKRTDKGRIQSILGLCETITTQAGKGYAPLIYEIIYAEELLRSKQVKRPQE